MNLHKQSWLLLLLIFGLALALRVAVALPAFQGARELSGDEPHYYRLGLALATTGRYELVGNPSARISPEQLQSLPPHPSAYRMPLLPLLLAPFYAVAGAQPFAGLPLILFCGALIPVGTYLLGRQLAGNSVALLAAGLALIDEQLIWSSHQLLTEAPVIAMLLFGLLAFEQLRRSGHIGWALLSGSLLAMATLTRANFGPFVPLALAWLIWQARHTAELRRQALRNALIIALIVGLAWSAWIVRNAVALEAFVPFTTQAGNAFFGIYHDRVLDPARGLRIGEWIWFEPPLPPAAMHLWSEVALDHLQKQHALAWISAHPAQALLIAMLQPLQLWRPDPQFSSNFPLYLLGSYGLLLALRRKAPGLQIWLLFAAVLSALALVSVGVPRYRLPLQPLLLVLVAETLLYALRRFAATPAVLTRIDDATIDAQ